MWRQMTRLLKYHYSWGQKRTWCYNSRSPGQPFTSLMDRINNDDVFRLNLILNGGWTKDTFHILEELIELALKQKEWNRRFGHMAYADRKQYYQRRKERFENERSGSDEQHVRYEDRLHPTEQEETLDNGLDDPKLRSAARALESKGKGIGKAGKKRPHQPDPSKDFSEFWDFSEAARWGYSSVPVYRRDRWYQNLPYQRGGASDEAASSTGHALPYRRDEIENCTQCNEPCAIVNMWRCERCSDGYNCNAYFHGYSRHRNCYEEHNHYCQSRSLYGWQRHENKRGKWDYTAAGR